MKYILIRHGKTAGNLEGRYIGARTDEPLCPDGIAPLLERRYPAVQGLFASPLRRCVQTAEIIYPDMEIQLVPNLRECDFGAFEGRNYAELKDDPHYQRWLDSGGEVPFPQGESRSDFAKRCVAAFEAAVCDLPDGQYAFVVHGGTIMALMERFARPKGEYYDFQLKNGEGYVLHSDGSFDFLE